MPMVPATAARRCVIHSDDVVGVTSRNVLLGEMWAFPMADFKSPPFLSVIASLCACHEAVSSWIF